MNAPSSTSLEERIIALIAAQGPISVAQYMTLALHDAKGGYYAGLHEKQLLEEELSVAS